MRVVSVIQATCRASWCLVSLLSIFLIPQEGSAEPFYRETFGYTSTLTTAEAAQKAGWKAIRTQRAIGKTSVWKINAPGSPNNPEPLNSDPQGTETGHGTWGESIPNGLIVYTDEIRFPISGLSSVRYEQRLSGLDSVGNFDKTRLALLINGYWYVSDQVRVPSRYSIWEQVEFILAETTFGSTKHIPCAGPAVPTNSGLSLPVGGVVQAMGVFLTKVHGRVRIDNYELDGSIAPTSTFESGNDRCPDGIGGINYPIEESDPPPGSCGLATQELCDMDSDGDSLKDWEENSLGTNPLVSDTDGDGETDGDEYYDGSQPLDRGSYFGSDATDACLPWNTYFGMWNVAEHAAARGFPVDISTTVRDLFGGSLGGLNFSLLGFEQRDLLIHDFPRQQGIEESYGTTCSLISGAPGSLRAGMLQYRPSSIPGRAFQFALAFEASPGLYGSQVLPFNTFSPSLGADRAGQLVANWLSIINQEPDTQTFEGGTLRFFNYRGQLLSSERVALQGRARRDFAGGHQFGPNVVGTIEFIPDNPQRRFQLSIARYVFKSGNYDADDVIAAVQAPGVIGSGQPLLVPLDTQGKTAVLELINASDSPISVQVDIVETDGTTRSSQTIGLEAKATHHLIADPILKGARGYAIVRGSKPESVVALGMHYVRDERLSVRKMWAIVAREALGNFHVMSYNSFLGQKNILWGVNPGSETETISVEYRTLEGQTLKEEVQLAPKTSLIAQLNPPKDQYGPVIVGGRRGKSLWWLLREHEDFTIPITANH